VNHRLNARLHKLPRCLECNAVESCPCLTERGVVRAPHRVRELVASGQLLAATREDARRVGALRAFARLADKIARVA